MSTCPNTVRPASCVSRSAPSRLFTCTFWSYSTRRPRLSTLANQGSSVRPGPAATSPSHRARLVWSPGRDRSEEHTSELQSQSNLVCRLLLEKKNKTVYKQHGAARPELGSALPSRRPAVL